MFKDVLNHSMRDADWFAQVGLVIFLIVFAGVVLRAVLASRSEMTRWADLPLGDDTTRPGEMPKNAEERR